MPYLIHKVSRDDFQRALKKFNELFNASWYGKYDFLKFIGYNDFEFRIDTILCSELALRKIEMLNSPHAYALMKAFIARTGYHKKLVERDHDRNPV